MNALTRYFDQMGFTHQQQLRAMNWLQAQGAISDNAIDANDVSDQDAINAAKLLFQGFKE